MEISSALSFQPPPNWLRLPVIDSHCAGEPFRVILGGFPEIPGATMLERRAYAITHLDRLRRALMWEPRGHADMYGGIVAGPVDPDSDLSVLFIHNEGFSTMCGHGVIALTTVALESGLLPAAEPETTVAIDTPAGRVVANADLAAGRVTRVRFRNVASFAVDLDAVVEVPGYGPVRYDLAFGGAFYAYVRAVDVGLTLTPGHLDDIIRLGRRIKQAVATSRPIVHPTHLDLGFLYGVIFTGAATDPAHHSRNVCVFADGEVDRSPTGTGVSGRLAIAHARGELGVDETITVESILGSVFTGRVVDVLPFEGVEAVIPEIGGEARIIGRGELWIDPDDHLGAGFLLR